MFLSLAPDTYTVTVAASSSRDAASVSGVTVQADQTLSVNLQQPTKLKQIGSVTSRAASALVKPGTTADVYSINATTQDKASALGGGGTLNQAWSAITSVPGVFVQPGQAGYIGAGPSVSIRGGDYDQIGYELDGVPVNRAFDNYPSGPVSSLGQQELQVYTGATPANSEAEGISGYINQVIRTGTAPATRTVDLGIGAPIMYNKISLEAGGDNPSRTFSYYLGAGAYNQDYRYVDQYDGASLQSQWGFPIAPCTTGIGVGCFGPHGQDYTNGGTTPAYVLAGPQVGNLSQVDDRDSVLNLHFGIPRKDGNRDDVQALIDINHISNIYNFSTNDFGGTAYTNAIGLGAPVYLDGYQFTGAPLGSLLGPGYTGGGVSNYLYPQSPTGRALFAAIAPNARDQINNDQGIFKLQYQHNFGTSAFLRVYGYTYYSAWLMADPVSTYSDYTSPGSPDYELSAHTRGVSAEFSDQLNSQHLLTIQGSFTTSTVLRDNNFQDLNFIGATSPDDTEVVGGLAGVLVDSSNPYNGKCYAPGGGLPVPCYNATGTNVNPGIGFFTLAQASGGPGSVPAATGTCGGGPCEYMLAENGQHALYNQVTPKFGALSITDQWKPTDKLNINLGLRFDSFVFDGGNTNDGPARDFWYAAWDAQFPALQQYNISNQVESYSELQPRAGLTYTLDPSTVVRASYGRYAQAPNSAFEQYNALQANVPIFLANFVAYGIGDTPGHNIRPEVSNNYDFSLEHQFNRDTSIKLTPFLRKTQDQIQQFYLDQKTNFVSGLNVGKQTSQGFELELDKGDFSRNGFAGRLSFTYTNSYINYLPQPNGNSVVYALNQGIANYNSYTSFCATHSTDARCQIPGAASPVAAPCYTTGGVAAPACGAGTVANPYWNAPVQQLLNPNANYATYDTFPGGIDAGGYEQYGAPYVGTLIVQWKHGPLAVTPALQFLGGQRYGAPLSTPGVAPDTCTGGIAAPAIDPRYPYGNPGGLAYNSTMCSTAGANGIEVAIPDPYTNAFDGVGAFVEPNQLLLHTQITYDVNKRLTLVANFANIIDKCWGGTKLPFNVNNACTYSNTLGSIIQPVGNVYNPGDAIQPFVATPYDPYFQQQPFAMYFEARFKL